MAKSADDQGIARFSRVNRLLSKVCERYGAIAKPLTDLLHKDSFKWSEEATQAFKQLQEAMTQVPVMALPYFAKPFTVETDVSGHGIGAVLLQESRFVAYFSQVLGSRAQVLGSRAQLKSVYERE